MRRMAKEDATILMAVRKRIAVKKVHELKNRRNELKKLPLKERLAERSITKLIEKGEI